MPLAVIGWLRKTPMALVTIVWLVEENTNGVGYFLNLFLSGSPRPPQKARWHPPKTTPPIPCATRPKFENLFNPKNGHGGP